MSDFKAKMHQIHFPQGLHLRSAPLRELTVLPQAPWLYLRGLLLSGGTGREGKGRGGEER